MKQLIKYSIYILLLTSISCNESEDLLTEDAREGGAIVTVGGSNGKVLGVPDPESGVISFTDSELTLKIAVETGGEGVESYSVVKKYNGGEEVVIAEVEKDQLPYTLALTSLDEFLNGTEKIANDLRIGDVFSFMVKMKLSDGRTIYAAPSNGVYNMTVNCSSDLAGTYTVSGIYNRPADGINGQAIGPRVEAISEISPGLYGTQLTGHWSLADLGVPACPIVFSDVCGTLTIDTQYLCDAYSNEVSGTGSIDPVTGDLHFEYTITGGNERSYVFDFVKN